MKKRRWRLCALVALGLTIATIAIGEFVYAQGGDELENVPVTIENFANPPKTVRPWAYYWNLKGNTSKELVTRDVGNMDEIGLGGMLVFDSRRYWDDYDSKTHVPVPLEIRHEFMSPGWRDVMATLVSEAAKREMQVSFNISDSGGQLRGPWDMKELGPYELVWAEGNVEGPKAVTLNCAKPDLPYFYDVATLAVRIASDDDRAREQVTLNPAWAPVALNVPLGAPKYDLVVDLSEKVERGRFDWDAPEGRWKILRFGAARIGEPGCVDILNREAVANYFEKMPGQLLKDVGDAAGTTLSHFYNVSWEGVHPNWTRGFEEFFTERRGYSIRDYLPVLRGLQPQNGPDGNRILADYMRTISDAFALNCYETGGAVWHERGVRWHSEDGGPWTRHSPLFKEADMLSFGGRNDFPQGEFWIGRIEQTNAPYAAMAAHIYGRKLVSLEAFTHMNKHWSVYPAILKFYADASFLAGANHMIWHTYTASEESLGKPGFEYFAGTHLNSNVTWQPYVKPFIDYMARCQLLLRHGDFVADYCVYTSDKNYVMWGLAEKWRDGSSLKAPNGYRYDLLDAPTLVDRLEYRDGKFTLPGGAQYRLLVFDPGEEKAPVEVMRKLKSLAEQGAPILLGDRDPLNSISAFNWREADEETRAIAKELRNAQANNIYRDQDVLATLDALGVAPDFTSDDPLLFVRRSSAELDVFFVATYQETRSGARNCVFRVEPDRVPTLWDPKTGEVTTIPYESTQDGRVRIPFVPSSTFIVFSSKEKPIAAAPYRDPNRQARRKIGVFPPCEVEFDPALGGPGVVRWNQLAFWNQVNDDRIKYYSGTAVYRFNVTLDEDFANSNELILKLGTVRDIARVKLNGVDCGIAWTRPYDVRIDDAAKPGENLLEIEVANCWQNRLIGDAALPLEERITKTNVVLESGDSKTTMPPYRGYLATDPLETSGLTGPIEIEAR